MDCSHLVFVDAISSEVQDILERLHKTLLSDKNLENYYIILKSNRLIDVY